MADPEGAGPDTTGALPPTRWAAAGSPSGYGEDFARMIDEGADVDGEARLADALAPRGARILDAGSGMGRVGAALQRRGHRVVGAEPDPALVRQSAATYPDLPVVPVEILGLTPERLREAGVPASYDLVVCVGNVLVYLGEGTERRVLTRLRELLADGGRILAGFRLTGHPTSGRDYPAEEFVEDATAAGLRVDARFGTYELHPANDEYVVWVLSAAG